jgi:hypothetical protein
MQPTQIEVLTDTQKIDLLSSFIVKTNPKLVFNKKHFDSTIKTSLDSQEIVMDAIEMYGFFVHILSKSCFVSTCDGHIQAKNDYEDCIATSTDYFDYHTAIPTRVDAVFETLVHAVLWINNNEGMLKYLGYPKENN